MIYFREEPAFTAQEAKILINRPGHTIRKVKAVSPSPFYDGKYHPPFIQQTGCFIIY